VIAIAGSVFGEEAARGEIGGNSRLSRQRWAESLKQRLKMPTNRYGSIASIISIIVLLFGASGIFAELQDALNTVWEVQPKPTRFN